MDVRAYIEAIRKEMPDEIAGGLVELEDGREGIQLFVGGIIKAFGNANCDEEEGNYQLTTNKRSEKTASGVVVDVFEVLDKTYKPGTHVVNVGVREATMQLIESAQAIYIVDCTHMPGYPTSARKSDSIIVGECDVLAYQDTIVPTLEVALAIMERRL